MLNLISTIQNLCYIDPAATSVLISSITAIAVALGATFIIIWRKMKKGVRKTFHIDENAGKVMEDDLVILDDESEENKDDKKENAEEVKTEKVEEKAELKAKSTTSAKSKKSTTATQNKTSKSTTKTKK